LATLDSTGNLSNAQPPVSAVIVSQDRLQANLLRSCLNNALPITVRCYTELLLRNVIDNPLNHRLVYLLDCLRIDVDAIESMLHLDLGRVPDHVLISLYNIRDESMLPPLVKRYRIRGIFFREDSQSVFIQGIQTILDGRLWLTRKMLSDCVHLSDRPSNEPASPCLELLSRREREILKHVVFGESNQEIAEAMQISLHTVKTHLYNTYKKINVPNRLQAALWGAAHLTNQPNN
jgi:LuxR family transcriptional regulator of csgAB operon